MMADMVPKYSLVVTCYFEEKSIDEFYTRVRAVLEKTANGFEIIFVNDGSTDATIKYLKRIFENDPHVSHVIDFTRNYGQSAAFTAGLCHAKGELIIYLDSDLQLAPEDIPLLLETYDQGFDAVKGKRMTRQDSWSRRLFSKLANVITRKSSDNQIKDTGCSFFVFPRKLSDQFNFGPHNIFTKMKLFHESNNVCEIPVQHFSRKYGRSGQTFLKLWSMNIENMIHLSDKTFQYIGLFGIGLSGLLMLRIMIGFLFKGQLLTNVSNGLLLNVIVMVFLFSLGVTCLIGEYSLRAFIQGEKTPKYIIRSILSR